MKKMLSVFLVLLLTFTFFLPDNTVYAAKIKLNRKTLDLCVGDSYDLKLNKDIETTWTSSSEAVAIVTASGTVIAVGEGRSTIKATVGEKSYSCKIIVVGYNLKYMIGNIGSFASGDVMGIFGSINNYVYFGTDSHMDPTTLDDILYDYNELLVQLEKYNLYITGLEGEEYFDIKTAWGLLYSETYELYNDVLEKRPSPKNRNHGLDLQSIVDCIGNFVDECIPFT